MKSAFIRLLLLALCSPVAVAGTRGSANYSFTTDSTDQGGLHASSANYAIDGSAGGIAGLSSVAAPSETLKSGYGGQLYDIISLSVTAPPFNSVNEGATGQLQAAPLADDGTTLAPLNPASVTWSVLTGPIASISSGGLASAGAVYQNTSATIQASAAGLTGQSPIVVVNINNDDFGSYAGDGIADAWQVQYFGLPPNPLAAPNVDADGNGETNLFKYLAGLNPLDPASHFMLFDSTVSGQPSQKQIIFSPVIAGRTYTVQYKDVLTAALWTPLPSQSYLDDGGVRTVTDPNATGTRFYRVQISKP